MSFEGLEIRQNNSLWKKNIYLDGHLLVEAASDSEVGRVFLNYGKEVCDIKRLRKVIAYLSLPDPDNNYAARNIAITLVREHIQKRLLRQASD